MMRWMFVGSGAFDLTARIDVRAKKVQFQMDIFISISESARGSVVLVNK